ncbi:MAG: A/G-specific adenine glycosylase [Sporolactobacillus sp.]
MNRNERIAFDQDLLSWFRKEGRDLPWRRTHNPYYIWVSEVMLQQTQVDTVKPYYKQFITDFATPEDLANAPEQDVLKHWEGLGYYSRARNLQQGVREVVARYDGQVPDEKRKLLDLHGIGPYTAGALLSIAFGQPEAAIDGNVMRVMSRVFMIDADIAKAKSKKVFEDVVEGLICETDPSAFNQAVMDLGAMICRPKNPNCPECPVRRHCKAYANSVQEQFPVKTRRIKQRTVYYLVLLIRDTSGRFFIERRPDTGLLAGLWQFPMIDYEAGHELYVLTDVQHDSFHYVHHFSHLIWDLTLCQLAADSLEANSITKNGNWVDFNELSSYPFPVAHQKVIDWIKTNQLS